MQPLDDFLRNCIIANTIRATMCRVEPPQLDILANSHANGYGRSLCNERAALVRTTTGIKRRTVYQDLAIADNLKAF